MITSHVQVPDLLGSRPSLTSTSVNASVIIFGRSARLRAVISSCPAPSMANNRVGAGISFSANAISSIEPKSSWVPCTNNAGVRRLGK